MAYKKSNANGQATMANSEPVVIASDQSAVPVTVSGVATAANQTTIIGHVDGIETLIGTTNTTLSTIDGRVDGLETLSTATNTKLDTVITHVDGLETLIGTTNSTLTTIEGDTSAIQTAVQLIDDTVATLGTTTYTEASTKGNVIGAIRRDANTTLVDTTNEVAPLQVNATGELKVAQIQALPAGTNNIGDVDVLTLPAIPAGTNNIGDVDVLTINGVAPAFGSGVRGATVQRVTIATDDSVPVTLGANQSVNVAQINGATTTMGNGASGTGVQRVTIASDSTGQIAITGGALTSLELADDVVLTDDAAVTLGTTKGNTVAGVAVNMDGTDPAAVSAEGDAALLRSDPNRILLVNQTHPRFFRASADYASAQTNTTVQAAPGASLSLYVTDVIISNGATAGNITLLDGSAGTVLLEVYPGINGGLTHSFRNPLKLTANTLLAITSTTVTTHSVTVTGYIAA